MSKVYDIIVAIDCSEHYSVNMYAANSSITNNQGSSELSIQVPSESVLRWRAIPFQAESEDGGKLHALITRVKLWGPGGNNPDDARHHLIDWGLSDGSSTSPVYTEDATEQFPGFGPFSDNYELTEEFPTQNLGVYMPYVQCTTHLRRDDSKVKVAYSFYASIYEEGTLKKEINWDPFVTIIR